MTPKQFFTNRDDAALEIVAVERSHEVLEAAWGFADKAELRRLDNKRVANARLEDAVDRLHILCD